MYDIHQQVHSEPRDQGKPESVSLPLLSIHAASAQTEQPPTNDLYEIREHDSRWNSSIPLLNAEPAAHTVAHKSQVSNDDPRLIQTRYSNDLFTDDLSLT